MLRSCMNYGWGWAPLLDIVTVPCEFKPLFYLLLDHREGSFTKVVYTEREGV